MSDKPAPKVFPAAQYQAEVIELYQSGIKPGQSTGWKNIDEFYTVHPDQVTVVTGIPGHGKSEWLDALMVNLAAKEDWLFAIYSPENNPVQLHLRKLLEKRLGKPLGPGPNVRATQDEMLQCLTSWITHHFGFHSYDIDLTTDLLAILENLRHWLKGYRPESNRPKRYGIVIDPWNEVESLRPGGQSETEYISWALGLLRRFARVGPYHIWLVAHPRMMRREKDGNVPVPTPYDISGSAHWFNKADNCITVWRDPMDDEREVELYAHKVRFKHTGRVGMGFLRYDRVTGQYRDA